MGTLATSISAQGKAINPSPLHTVCIHVLREARADIRLLRSATALVEAGFAVSVVDVEANPRCPAKEEIHGVSIEHMIVPAWYKSRRMEAWFLLVAVQTFVLSIVRLMQTRADVYHANELTALPACFLVALLRRKPLIFEIYDLQFPVPYTQIGFWRRVGASLYALLLPRCAGVIVTSPLHGRAVQRRYHVHETALVRNVPTYRQVPKTNRLREYLGLDDEVRIALYQGNLQSDRGLDRLIPAAKHLHPKTVIVMMGKNMESTKEHLEALIAQEQVADRVKILPAVPYEELLDWTASADIGLTTFSPEQSLSIRYTLPNKLFEYLMAGLPVLSLELDAIAEVLRRYEVGHVLSSLDPAEIGRGINAMLQDEQALDHMHNNALEASQQELCWDKEKGTLIHFYQKILAQGEEMRTPALHKVCIHVLREARADIRLLRSATALVEAGFAVSVVDVEANPRCPAKEEIHGVSIEHMIVPAWYKSRRMEAWFLLVAVQTFVLSIVRLMQTRADVYHANELTALPACFLVALLRRKPLIFEIYDLQFPVPYTQIGFWRRVGASLYALLLPRCAGVIVTSPLHGRAVQRRYHVHETALVRNVPTYRKVSKTNRLREYLGLDDEVRIALYQGNLQSDRGLDRLIPAAKHLHPKTVIVMMGKNMESTKEHLEALIAQEQVADRVKILPAVPYEELLDWTASADIGLTIYTWEHSLNVEMMLPNKVFEYMMAGLPVLSSPLHAIVDVLETFGTGQVVTSLEAEDIGNAINTMVTDDALLTRMRLNGLKAAEEFCWEKEKVSLIHLYQKIVRDNQIQGI